MFESARGVDQLDLAQVSAGNGEDGLCEICGERALSLSRDGICIQLDHVEPRTGRGKEAQEWMLSSGDADSFITWGPKGGRSKQAQKGREAIS